MSDKLFIELKLVDQYGHVHGVVRREIGHDVAFCGQRAAERFRGGALEGVTVDDAVEILKARELRREKLRVVTPLLGEQLADFLYDREGWSDPDRQARTEEIARKAGY